MPAEHKRSTRVAERVQQELSSMLLQEYSNPRLSAVVVTRVEVSDDLQQAHIHVRHLTSSSQSAQRGVLNALAGVGGKLRRQLAGVLQLRRMPELRFHYDEGHDHRSRVEELLAEIHREKEPS